MNIYNFLNLPTNTPTKIVKQVYKYLLLNGKINSNLETEYKEFCKDRDIYDKKRNIINISLISDSDIDIILFLQKYINEHINRPDYNINDTKKLIDEIYIENKFYKKQIKEVLENKVMPESIKEEKIKKINGEKHIILGNLLSDNRINFDIPQVKDDYGIDLDTYGKSDMYGKKYYDSTKRIRKMKLVKNNKPRKVGRNFIIAVAASAVVITNLVGFKIYNSLKDYRDYLLKNNHAIVYQVPEGVYTKKDVQEKFDASCVSVIDSNVSNVHEFKATYGDDALAAGDIVVAFVDDNIASNPDLVGTIQEIPMDEAMEKINAVKAEQGISPEVRRIANLFNYEETFESSYGQPVKR